MSNDQKAPKWRARHRTNPRPIDDEDWEWWDVTDETRTFRADNKVDAEWLAAQLNGLAPQEQ